MPQYGGGTETKMNNGIWNILDYGAVSSEEVNQSKAIQKAIDACQKHLAEVRL